MVMKVWTTPGAIQIEPPFSSAVTPVRAIHCALKIRPYQRKPIKKATTVATPMPSQFSFMVMSASPKAGGRRRAA